MFISEPPVTRSRILILRREWHFGYWGWSAGTATDVTTEKGLTFGDVKARVDEVYRHRDLPFMVVLGEDQHVLAEAQKAYEHVARYYQQENDNWTCHDW